MQSVSWIPTTSVSARPGDWWSSKPRWPACDNRTRARAWARIRIRIRTRIKTRIRTRIPLQASGISDLRFKSLPLSILLPIKLHSCSSKSPTLTTRPATRSSPCVWLAANTIFDSASRKRARIISSQLPAQCCAGIQCFRTFFLQCHRWLDFSIPTSPGAVYAKNPLLFWVICAVSSSTNTMLRLQPGIQEMIGKVVVNPPRSLETVQALLILCMWPLPFYSMLGDPSFVYLWHRHTNRVLNRTA